MTIITCLFDALDKFVELQSQMVAVERVTESSKTPSESGNQSLDDVRPSSNISNTTSSKLQVPPSDWPRQGCITFISVSMKYRKDMPEILKNISLSIAASEKVWNYLYLYHDI